MAATAERRVSWFLWPFYVLWRLLSFILSVTGRLVCALLGVLLLALGATLALTIVGAPVGLPLAILGFLLLLRAVF